MTTASDRLTDAEIAAALDLCARATEGPWSVENWRVSAPDGSEIASTIASEDAVFIAAARDILPRALGEIRRTRAIAAERYEEAVRIARGGCDATE
jgi:hypothetical protein